MGFLAGLLFCRVASVSQDESRQKHQFPVTILIDLYFFEMQNVTPAEPHTSCRGTAQVNQVDD
jgi:hypothetical protein